jgi:replication factor C large subunit
MLLNKYKPKSLNEIIGQDLAISKLRKAVNEKKAILIYGVPGIGKSSSVHVLAKDLNFEILEVNASDYRNKEQIEETVGSSSRQASLFSKGKIILIDEIDGLNSRDRGAITEIVNIIKNTGHPVVIIGNDIWDSKFKDLRKNCELIPFEKLNYIDILKILKSILHKENKNVDEEHLRKMVVNSKGDARSAINDLELLMISKDDIDIREKKETISNALKNIFKTKNQNEILKGVELLDENLDEVFLWLEENIPYEYKNEVLKDAYDYLSKADVFRGRIRRWQYWRYLVYQNALMNLGIAFSKDKEDNKIVSYKRNSRILKIWINNRREDRKKELSEKLSKELHMSKNKFIKEFVYMKFLH